MKHAKNDHINIFDYEGYNPDTHGIEKRILDFHSSSEDYIILPNTILTRYLIHAVNTK